MASPFRISVAIPTLNNDGNALRLLKGDSRRRIRPSTHVILSNKRYCVRVYRRPCLCFLNLLGSELLPLFDPKVAPERAENQRYQSDRTSAAKESAYLVKNKLIVSFNDFGKCFLAEPLEQVDLIFGRTRP